MKNENALIVQAGLRFAVKQFSSTANPRVGFVCGAGEMNRTPDLLITNELLYRLSYTGEALDYRPAW